MGLPYYLKDVAKLYKKVQVTDAEEDWTKGMAVAPDSDRSWLLKSDMVVCQLWEGRSLIQQLHQTSASCWGSERW
ncbi:unnamed protein product [Gadus morhua 'NCC']